MIKIIRQNRGKARTRFGILLSSLKPRHQRVLLKNEVIKKNSGDDNFLNCLFQIEDSRINISYKMRPFINLETQEVSTFATVKDSYKILDWKCAFCKTDIKSRVDKFDSKNFCCSKCYTYYIKDNNQVSQLIIDSMIKFGDYYKKLMRETQQKFIKYIKKNEKRNSLL